MTFLAAALAELARDPHASVFPIEGKTPKTRWRHGDPALSLARTPEQAERLAERFPRATGAGIALRADQGVYDCDTPAAVRWCLAHLPDTREVATGRPDGRHFYVALPTPLRHNPRLRPEGLEFKTLGGYVVAPGSRHTSGLYYTVRHDVPVAEIPVPLANKLGRPRKLLDGSTDATPAEIAAWSGPPPAETWVLELAQQGARDQLADTERWLRRELPRRDTGWGDALFGQAARLGVWVGHGTLSHDAAVEHLTTIFHDLDSGTLDDAQHALRSIRRGIAAGARSAHE